MRRQLLGDKHGERRGCGVLGTSEDNGTTSADVNGMEDLVWVTALSRKEGCGVAIGILIF